MKRTSTAAFLATVLAIFFNTGLSAQDTVHVVAKGMYANGQVVLRWAPADIPSWRYGNANGYTVARKTLRSNDTLLPSAAFEASHLLLSASLLALPEGQWEAMADTNDLAGVAAGAIYGDSLDLLPAEGGGILQVYNKYRELESRFGFSLFAADQDLQIAQNMGLALIDTAVQANKDYVYFITALGTAATSGGFAMVNTDSAAVARPPGKPTAIPSDKKVLLQWDRDAAQFSSFAVERAGGGVDDFVRLNVSPLVFASTTGLPDELMSFTDSLVDNSTQYTYRVRGLTPFGMWSEPSDTVQVSGKPAALSLLMSIQSVEELSEGVMTVTWEFPAAQEGQVLGFDVYRSDKVNGKFLKVNTVSLGVSLRAFEDTDPLPANYYIVKTSDANGYEYQTFPYLGQPSDDTPPSQPLILAGESSPDGTVTLSWAKNPDADVLGYRVFMSSVQNGDYAQITSTWVNDTVYRYQVPTNTLTEEVYFGVKALDFRENQSVMSAPFLVMRPDNIAPAAPVIKKAVSGTAGVYFEWDLSPSADVVSYKLERKEVDRRSWLSVLSFDTSAVLLSYTDSSASLRSRYEYRLIATDDAELQTSSNIVKARPVDTGLRHDIQNFVGQLIATPKSIILEWDYTDDADLIGFEIFRAIQDSNRQRSYAYLKIPPGQAGAASGSSATLTGNQWHCVYTDSDLNFSLKQLNSFIVLPNPNANPNASVPTPGAPPAGQNHSTVTISNPNNLSGQQVKKPTVLYYWVMAKYADGGYSPVKGALGVAFQ